VSEPNTARLLDQHEVGAHGCFSPRLFLPLRHVR
jgi:hypothetical protein